MSARRKASRCRDDDTECTQKAGEDQIVQRVHRRTCEYVSGHYREGVQAIAGGGHMFAIAR